MATFGRYEILDKLGEGAMGVVYRARDASLGRVVALKMLSADLGAEEELHQRFQREAEAIGRLSHPNIVTVYDVGEASGQLYMAMELLEGDDLRSLIEKRAAIPLAARVRILIQICTGLAYAHSRRVVHRCTKPANILVGPDEGAMDGVAGDLSGTQPALRGSGGRATLPVPAAPVSEETRARVRDRVAQGRALLDAGHADRAVTEMKDALRLDPSAEDAAELLWRAGRKLQDGRSPAPALDSESERRVSDLLTRAAPGGADDEVRSAVAELVLIAPDDPRVTELLRERSGRHRR